MEQAVQIAVNNGLGVVSFLALLYFMNNYMTKINATVEKISQTSEKTSQTLVTVEKTLSDLSKRVEKIERKETSNNDN